MQVRTIALAFVLAGVAAPSLGAQTLVSGTWAAQLTKSDFSVHDYGLEVAYVHDTLAIALVAGANRMAFLNVRRSADTLRFTVPDENGPTECRLVRKSNGSFGGPCLNGEKKTSQLLITPPKAPE